jgi:hypothetical protein
MLFLPNGRQASAADRGREEQACDDSRSGTSAMPLGPIDRRAGTSPHCDPVGWTSVLCASTTVPAPHPAWSRRLPRLSTCPVRTARATASSMDRTLRPTQPTLCGGPRQPGSRTRWWNHLSGIRVIIFQSGPLYAARVSGQCSPTIRAQPHSSRRSPRRTPLRRRSPGHDPYPDHQRRRPAGPPRPRHPPTPPRTLALAERLEQPVRRRRHHTRLNRPHQTASGGQRWPHHPPHTRQPPTRAGRHCDRQLSPAHQTNSRSTNGDAATASIHSWIEAESASAAVSEQSLTHWPAMPAAAPTATRQPTPSIPAQMAASTRATMVDTAMPSSA